MTQFEQLKRHVASGEIVLVHIDAVPRSMSTALEIASAQLADAQVNEPFNRGRCDLNAAAADVLRATASLERDQPIVVVTKAIASEIDPHFSEWIDICNAAVFSVRHPLIQMSSLLERIGNDAITGRGTSAMDLQALEPFAAQVDSLAANNEFKRASWRELSNHYTECAFHDSALSMLLVDGDAFSRSPHQVLSHIAALMGRPYHRDMAVSWKTGARGRFNNPNHFDSDLDQDGISVNAWVRRAQKSTQIEPSSRRGMCLRYWQSHYPLTYSYLVGHAIPIYEYLASSGNKAGQTNQSPVVDEYCRARHLGQDCALSAGS